MSTQPGYQEDGERVWWWRVAQHLDAAQIAAVNAMAHNLDAPAWVFGLQEKLRDAQVILLEIFGAKGLLPAPNGHGQEHGHGNGHDLSPPPPPPPPPSSLVPPPEAPADVEVVSNMPPEAPPVETAMPVIEELAPAATEPSSEAAT